MQGGRLEHAGVVTSIAGRSAIVEIRTDGCSGCGHGAHCGIGQLARERPATRLTVPLDRPLVPGEVVTVALSARQLERSALLGYLLPAVAMLLGAALGEASGGSDEAAALGALAGLLTAVAVARLALTRIPRLATTPHLLPAQADPQPHAPPTPGARP